MTGAVVDRLLERIPPRWTRKAEAAVLMKVFAEAFGVDAPRTRVLSADDALAAFRELTAACMETALEDAQLAACYRQRLGEAARRLGAKVRAVPGLAAADASALTRFFYRGIGINLQGSLPGALEFRSCYFAQRYSPACCWFMSAFDEGFMQGMAGTSAHLSFSSRLTEGAAHCCARFE